jgi:hypothetical protein
VKSHEVHGPASVSTFDKNYFQSVLLIDSSSGESEMSAPRVFGGGMAALAGRAAVLSGRCCMAASCSRSLVSAAGSSTWHSAQVPAFLLSPGLQVRSPAAGAGAPREAPGGTAWTDLPIIISPGLVDIPAIAPMGPGGVDEDGEQVQWEAMNRNARVPKKANHGKRPCSHYGRKRRAKARKPLKGK